jgi:hypothetical protein
MPSKVRSNEHCRESKRTVLWLCYRQINARTSSHGHVHNSVNTSGRDKARDLVLGLKPGRSRRQSGRCVNGEWRPSKVEGRNKCGSPAPSMSDLNREFEQTQCAGANVSFHMDTQRKSLNETPAFEAAQVLLPRDQTAQGDYETGAGSSCVHFTFH